MRVRSRFFFVVLALTGAVAPADELRPPDRQSSGAADEADLPRLVEFLDWAHPPGACASPTGVRITGRWAGGLTARYEIVCGAQTRALQGVFRTRARDRVWQVAE